MKLWDDILNRLFPSTSRSVILLLHMFFGIFIIPFFLWLAGAYLIEWGIIFPSSQIGIIYGAYVMFFAFVWRSLSIRGSRERPLREVRATVIGLRFKGYGSDDSAGTYADFGDYLVYSPVVQFTDSKGEQITGMYRYIDKMFQEKPSEEKLAETLKKMEKTLDIVYDPKDPTVAIMPSNWLVTIKIVSSGLAIVGELIIIYFSNMMIGTIAISFGAPLLVITLLFMSGIIR